MATIITGLKQIASALRSGVSGTVCVVDPAYLALSEPGYTADYEPQYRTMAPEVKKEICGFQGDVICAVPPGLLYGALLVNLLHTLNSSRVLYVPLTNLDPKTIPESLNQPQEISPWFVASVLARRLAERIIEVRLASVLSGLELPYPGWESLFYLHLIHAIAEPSWRRTLHFGDCVAVEVDPFGGPIHHSRNPVHICGDFSVFQRQTEIEWPECGYAINRILKRSRRPLEKTREELANAYFNGQCSWPFHYGAVSYGEPPIRTKSGEMEIFQSLNQRRACRKIVRLYQQSKIRFRSLSYYPEGLASINAVSCPATVKVVAEPQLPCATLDAFLERLEGYQLNLNISSLRNLLDSGCAQCANTKLATTAKGQSVLEQLRGSGIRFRHFYITLRLLEGIQTNEFSYVGALDRIRSLFATGKGTTRSADHE